MRDGHRRAIDESAALALRACWVVALALSLARTDTASAETRPIRLEPNPTNRPADGFGAGEYVVDAVDDIPPEQRREIQRGIDANVAALRAQRVLPPAGEALTTHVLFDWPLRLAAGFVELGYHGISNFVDQNPAFPNQLLDWSCGTRTYDLASGYNHAGIDIFTWPFPWNKMDAGEVEIAAAAAGTIVGKSDGNYDRNCGFNGLGANAVYVMHADGSVAWYFHMQNGSVTTKSVGQPVAAGEYLGRVGSSGNSTGPHLHFEVHDASNALIDPFFASGGCNALNSDTWWNAQPPYYDPAVLELTTGNGLFSTNSCPSNETTHELDAFVPGATVYFTSFYRDLLSGQSTTLRARRPDDSVFCSSPLTSSAYYSAAYIYMVCTIGSGEPLGTWHFEVDFDGQTYSQPFELVVSTTTSTTTTTTLPPLCGSVPEAGCRLAQAGGASVKIKDDADDARDGFKWSWAKGASTFMSDFKNPVNGFASYRVCVYDASASAQPRMEAGVLPRGTCGSKPCWKASGASVVTYKNAAGTPSGITGMKLSASASGVAKISVNGKGVNLPTPPLPLTLPAVVQLLIKDGSDTKCWQATYSTATSTSTVFRAKSP